MCSLGKNGKIGFVTCVVYVAQPTNLFPYIWLWHTFQAITWQDKSWQFKQLCSQDMTKAQQCCIWQNSSHFLNAAGYIIRHKN